MNLEKVTPSRRGQIENGTNLTELLNLTFTGSALPNDSIQLVYAENGIHALQIPEPATAALSLLGICGLALRRRRDTRKFNAVDYARRAGNRRMFPEE